MARTLHNRRDVQRRGFTLIEMMVVVAIVGVLSIIAVVSYRKIIATSRMSEATGMVQAIRVAQEAYHAETQAYADISSTLESTYPQTAPGAFKTGWGGACNGTCKTGIDWSVLPLHVDAPVLFAYSTIAGFAGTDAFRFNFNGTAQALPQPSPSDWFEVMAKGDYDGNGTFCRIYGTSFSNELLIENEGE